MTNYNSSKFLDNRLQNIKVNNWCNCKHVSVGVFSCKRFERRDRQFPKFLTQALWDVSLFQLVKGDFPQGNIAYIFSEEDLKNNGFSFTKFGNFCFLF